MTGVRLSKFRDWQWVPHLLACYGILGVLWIITGFALFLVAGGDTEQAVFGTNTTGVDLGLPLVAYPLVLLVIVIPMLAVAATIRVVTNEQRWRREGDPRGK